MAERPSIQFYFGDWRKNSKLRRCSWAARGAWIEVMGVLHDSDEYGVVRWPFKDLVQASGVPRKLAQELLDKGVLKGADGGAEPYVWRPRHAGKYGEPVTLVDSKGGPVWYCSRMVRDEYVRLQRGASTRFGAPPKPTPIEPPKGGIGEPFGGVKGDGASASTSSSSTNSSEVDTHTSEGRPEPPKPPPKPLLTAAARASMAMIQAGCETGANPHHAGLLEAIAEGVTPEQLAEAVKLGLGRTPPITLDSLFAWSITVARRQLAEAKTKPSSGASNGQARNLSASERVARRNAEAEAAERSAAERRAGSASGGVSCFDPDAYDDSVVASQ